MNDHKRNTSIICLLIMIFIGFVYWHEHYYLPGIPRKIYTGYVVEKKSAIVKGMDMTGVSDWPAEIIFHIDSLNKNILLTVTWSTYINLSNGSKTSFSLTEYEIK